MIAFSRTIEEFRKHVPVTEEWAYFESAGTGLIPDFVYDGVRRYLDDRYFIGGDSRWEYKNDTVNTFAMMERTKKALAKMIHCSASEVAFGQSATQLFTMVTEGIDYAKDDNVVTVDQGWIGMRYAWQKREDEELEVRYAKTENGIVSAEQLIALCDEHTRAISVNLVEPKTGYRIDIEKLGKICKERNILLFVDGVQALGALHVDVQQSHIDFLVGNDYKWMMNFCGTGYAYISPQVQSMIHHWGAGWMSDADRFDTSKSRLTLRSDAGQFEIGYPAAFGIYGIGLIAEQNTLLGSEKIEEYVCTLEKYFRQRISERKDVHCTYSFEDKYRSQIISIKIASTSAISNEKLRAAKIFAHLEKADENGEREMRLGFHLYNHMDDIDRFIDLLDECKIESKIN